MALPPRGRIGLHQHRGWEETSGNAFVQLSIW